MDDPTKDVVARWFIKADNDIQTAKRALYDDHPITDTASFHAQQCFEKSLKAFMAAMGVHPEKTHDLVRLIELCAKHDLEFLKHIDIADRITKYAVSSRYPGDWREITINEAENALRDAEEVMTFVKNKLKL
ncbi:MAG: HEPN domain-containing protein [Calditrichaeota bacterium]|nr:HEPN domain-containing protein [Calditrichota bacterium]